MTGPAPSARRRSSGHDPRVLAVLGSIALAAAPATAQEPLILHIRPLPDAEAARAAREALFARRQAHARAVIESVCTGCLGAWKSETVPADGADQDRLANLAVPIGVEPDPQSGASDTVTDPSNPVRHP